MSSTHSANTDADTAIKRAVKARSRDAVAFLAKLVQVPSDNPPGNCVAHADATAALLEKLGLSVERHPVPDALCKAVGMIAATNLVVRKRFGQGPTIALNAHGDVVPPGTGWTTDPYAARVKDGTMFGRGVAVSKSDIATYAFALLALIESKVPVRHGTVELHITYDEETGGEIGPKYLLDKGISKPDLAIGAGFSYAVVTAHNGCLHLEVEVTGRSAHAAKPWTGIDALEAANHVLSALYAYRRSLSAKVSQFAGIGSPQLTVGLISGGINTNVVPDRITFRLDRRMIPDERPAEVEKSLGSVIEGAARAFPAAKVVVKRILLAEPLKPSKAGAKLTSTLLARASEATGEEVQAIGSPLYTDARHYAAAGVPIVLYGAGPRTIEEANAHRADENLKLEDLHRATEAIALTLHDILR